MQCPRCGARIDRGEYSCPDCGKIIGLADAKVGSATDSRRFSQHPDRFRRSAPSMTAAPTLTSSTRTKLRFEYAGFSFRLLALVIDSALLGLLATAWSFDYDFGPFSIQSLSLWHPWTLFSPMTFIAWLYFAIFEGSGWQGTPGKMLCGIRVTDMHGHRITLRHALGRNLAKILSAVIFFFGFFIVLFTNKKQALHDLIAGTLVIMKD